MPGAGRVLAVVRGEGPGARAGARSPSEPRTPLELWDAADYLVRTGQASKAVPYLDKFLKSQPDDATLLAIRDRYGPGSILRLDDDPETRPFAQPLVDDAGRRPRGGTRPGPSGSRGSSPTLTKTPEEQDYAVERLREAGPYAVPSLVEALRAAGALAPRSATCSSRNMGRLDRSAVPPLVAALDSPDARARGRRGHGAGRDRRRRGRPVPDVPGRAADAGEPGRASRRAGGDRAADRPAVRRAAAAPRSGC